MTADTVYTYTPPADLLPAGAAEARARAKKNAPTPLLRQTEPLKAAGLLPDAAGGPVIISEGVSLFSLSLVINNVQLDVKRAGVANVQPAHGTCY